MVQVQRAVIESVMTLSPSGTSAPPRNTKSDDWSVHLVAILAVRQVSLYRYEYKYCLLLRQQMCY